MTQKDQATSRRGLLFGAAVVSAGATALVALPQVAPQEAVVENSPKPAPEKGGGYHVTARIKQYYSTALI